jgi:hypothetical protein
MRGRAFPVSETRSAGTLAELDGALLDADDLHEPLASFVRSYRAELERLDAWDRGLLRRRAIERLTGEVASWGDSPVLVHGFEDLTGAEWRLLEALAARTDVHVSLPYEPGRAVYASLARTATDLAALAGDRIAELPPRAGDFLPPPLAHVERELFGATPHRARPRRLGPFPRRGGNARYARAGRRGGARHDPLRRRARRDRDPLPVPRRRPRPAGDGPSRRSACRSHSRGERAFAQRRSGHALLALLRFAWLEGERPELYAHLRSPYSGVQRREVDWVEGKLRGPRHHPRGSHRRGHG